MTAIDEWHAADHDLHRYGNGTIPAFVRASVEAHLLDCPLCRARLDDGLANTRPAREADIGWAGITDRIDVPHRARRSSTTAFDVSLASPPLIAATAGLAIGLIFVTAIVATIAPRTAAPVFLALAPLTPVAGALLAFQPGIDPAGRLALATPLAVGRLPFLRALMSSATAIAAIAVASLFVPLGATDIALWLLPGLALATTVVAAATWIDPRRITSILMFGWLAFIVTWLARARTPRVTLELDDLAISHPPVQAMLVGITLVASAICFLRRDALPDWRTR